MIGKEEESCLKSAGVELTNSKVQLVLKSFNRLLPFQRTGVLSLLKRGEKACLFDEPGLGKSCQSLIAVFLRFFSLPNSPSAKVVIVCPSMLKLNWWSEIEAWLPMIDFDEVRMVISKNEVDFSDDSKKIYILSYNHCDLLATDSSNLNIHSLILDESHLLKNFMSIRTLDVCSIRASYSILLSGTPMIKKPCDLMSQAILSLTSAELSKLKKEDELKENDVLSKLFLVEGNLSLIQEFFATNKSTCWKAVSLGKELSVTEHLHLRNALEIFVDFLSSCMDSAKISGTHKHSFHSKIKKRFFPTITCKKEYKFDIILFLESLKSFYVLHLVVLSQVLLKFEFMFCCHQLLCTYSGKTVKLVKGKRCSKRIISYKCSFSPYFLKFFNSRCIRRSKTDVIMDLPSRIIDVQYVACGPNSIKNSHEEIPELNEEPPEMTSEVLTLAESVSLLPNEFETELRKIGFSKVENCCQAIYYFCQTCEENCIVFAKHERVLEGLQFLLSKQLLNVDVICLTGKTNPNDRMRVLRAFEKNSKQQLLLMSTTANGFGVNLSSASRAFFCELLWSSEQMLQAEERMVQIDPHKACVHVTYLLAKNTFEEKLWVILQKRRKDITSVYAQLRSSTTPEGDVVKHKVLFTSSKDFPKDDHTRTWGFRVNAQTNNIHIYQSFTAKPNWHLLGLNVAFESCLQFKQLQYAALSTALHAFASNWVLLKQKEKKELTDLRAPLQLPLECNTTGSGMSKMPTSFDEINTFQRHTTADVQMHGSASIRFGFSNYVVRQMSLISGETVNVALDLGQTLILCKFCAKPLNIVERENVCLVNLFCNESTDDCFFRFLRKCCLGKARNELRSLEYGVCQECKVDTLKLLNNCKKEKKNSGKRLEVVTCPEADGAGSCPHTYMHFSLCIVKKHWTKKQVASLSKKQKSTIENATILKEGLFWQADHILAVKLGGLSIAENFQTLCLICHSLKTKDDVRKMRALKKKV